MSEWNVAISDIASDADTAALRDALHEFNASTTGYRDGLALSCFLRNGDELVAGIDGYTWGGYARVDYLWVSESQRGNGLGSKLLAAAEEEARRRGCVTIVQAPDLYRSRGYAEIGATVDTPVGHSQLFFQKAL